MNVYRAESLAKALEKASKELNIPKEELNYKVIKKSKSFFKQLIEIEIVSNQKHFMEKEKEPLADDLPRVQKEIVDNKKILRVEVSRDKLEAYIILAYEVETNDISSVTPQDNAVFSEELTASDLLQLLKEKNIKFGLIHKNIQNIITSASCGKYLVAKGKAPVDEVEDKVHIYFKQVSAPTFSSDEKETIRYKELCAVASVRAGELLGSLEKGKTGQDGTNVYGHLVPGRKAKKHIFRAGKGAQLQGEDEIIAAIDGKPFIRNGIFEVNEVYEHRGDVDIKSGSLSFQGNIKIYGSVSEGMRVESSGDVEILGSVERAVIVSEGNVAISGSLLHSHVNAGGKDNQKLKIIKLYLELQTRIDALIETLVDIKKYQIVGDNKSQGQIIKALLESKFKGIPKVAKEILDSYGEGLEEDAFIKKIIVTKILGLMPVTIKHYSELQEFTEALKAKAIELSSNVSLPVNAVLNYCQDSEIYSSGDIIFNGRGEYQSKITAAGKIYFEERSVARGGSLQSGKEIRCGTIGSAGGVITKLSVPKHGEIFAESAYQNTLFTIGDKEKLLELPKKKVHVYLGEDGLITIDGYSM